ncbi:MAG: hypothetical protein KME42_23215 [Tildeniella nuda ZEHNDER 1965/U140]|nr:hypothetical protein [Tildeniella nuda ZEHNDER 1965/U140]
MRKRLPCEATGSAGSAFDAGFTGNVEDGLTALSGRNSDRSGAEPFERIDKFLSFERKFSTLQPHHHQPIAALIVRGWDRNLSQGTGKP